MTQRLNRPKDAAIICPQCGSENLRRSHSRGIEKILKYFNQRAYRCEDCSWRGMINTKSGKSRKKSFRKGYPIGRLVFIGVVLLITVYILVYLVGHMQ